MVKTKQREIKNCDIETFFPDLDPQQHTVMFFDGYCHLCSRSVDFVLKHDPGARFKFLPLQSLRAQKLIEQSGLPKELDSLVLLENKTLHIKSTAVLHIVKHLSGGWPLFFPLIVIPVFLRDAVYDWIARNRFSWFARLDICHLPTPENTSRFLG